MDLQFTQDELAFRDEVRQFLDVNLTQQLRTGAHASPAVFVEPDIGLAWQRILHEKGWLAYNWPAEHGGTGWTPVQRYIFEMECARAGAPVLPGMGLKLVGPVIYTFGTPEQKERFLPKLLSGEHFWCQGFSEPGSGSDLASLQTRAEKQGDRYIVNGTKLWTTQAQHANWMFCLARTDTTVKPQRGITFLLIDMNQPGVTVRPILTLAGDHEVNEVFLDNVVALEADRIGEEGQGWAIAKFMLENERGGSCHAPALVSSIEAIKRAAAEEPSGMGGMLLDKPSFAARLARVKLEVEALRLTELRILAELAQGRPPGPQTSLVKLMASNLHQKVDQLAMEVWGYAGLQLPPERPLYGDDAPKPLRSKCAQLAAARYLNSRAWTIFGGSNEIQYNIVAKTVLGL